MVVRLTHDHGRHGAGQSHGEGPGVRSDQLSQPHPGTEAMQAEPAEDRPPALDGHLGSCARTPTDRVDQQRRAPSGTGGRAAATPARPAASRVVLDDQRAAVARQPLLCPARAPKPHQPGPGRPPGSKNKYRAPRYDAGKTVLANVHLCHLARQLTAHRRETGCRRSAASPPISPTAPVRASATARHERPGPHRSVRVVVVDFTRVARRMSFRSTRTGGLLPPTGWATPQRHCARDTRTVTRAMVTKALLYAAVAAALASPAARRAAWPRVLSGTVRGRRSCW